MSQSVQIYCTECKIIPEQYITLICDHNFCLNCLSVMYMKYIQDQQINDIKEIHLPCNVCNKKTELDSQSIEALETIIQQTNQEFEIKKNRNPSRITKDYPFFQKVLYEDNQEDFNTQFYKNQDQKKQKIISQNSSKDKITMTECLRDSYIQSVDNYKIMSNKNKEVSKSKIILNDKIIESNYESLPDENFQQILNQNYQLQKKDCNIQESFVQCNKDSYLKLEDKQQQKDYEKKKKIIETQLRLIEDPFILLNSLLQKKQEAQQKIDEFRQQIQKNQKELINQLKEKIEKFNNELDRINEKNMQQLDQDIQNQSNFNNLYEKLQAMMKDKYNSEIFQLQFDELSNFQNQDISIFKYQVDQQLNNQILDFFSKLKNDINSFEIYNKHQKNKLSFDNKLSYDNQYDINNNISSFQNYDLNSNQNKKQSNIIQKDSFFKNKENKIYLNSNRKNFDMSDNKKDASPFGLKYKNSQFLNNSIINSSQNYINFNRNDSVKQLNFDRKPISGIDKDSFRLGNQKSSYLNKFDILKPTQYMDLSTKKFKF